MSVKVASPNPFLFDIRNETGINWEHPRNARVSFSLRLSNAFFANEWCSDISFYVPMDDRTVPAHTLIVASASPVLQRCCFGTGNVTGGRIVTVPDYCSTEVLLIVLRYLYIGGVAEGIKGSNVGLVLKLADFYELCDLQKQCESTIKSILSDSTVCSIFNHIHTISNDLVDECMGYMQEHTGDILDNGSAMDMEDAALKKLLDANSKLDVSEAVLASAMLKWADTQCLSTAIAISPTNRRRVLGERFRMINYGAMSLIEFLDCVDMFGDGCFTEYEIAYTTQQIHRCGKLKANNEQFVYPFPSNNRFAFNITTCDLKRGACNNNIIGQFVHSLDLNVAHMKKPFNLVGIKIMKNITIENIANRYNNNRDVSFTIDGEFAKFKVKPEKHGKITLKIRTRENTCTYYINESKSNYPTVLGPTFVTALQYTNPID